jgi:dienelactone hydrolase
MRFFDDDDMDFAVRCVLSGVRHAMAEVGETLHTAASATDGDADSWLDAFVRLGRRVRAEADIAVRSGHDHSAWNAALRAANYLYAGLWWAPATARAHERLALWEEHRDAWDLAVEHWPSPVTRGQLDHLGGAVPTWWFQSPTAPSTGASAVVLVTGLGTPISDACMTGLDGALARGHHVLVLEGPGQGETLYRSGRTLDRSWPQLLQAALSSAAAHPGVDPSAVGLLGVGAGALFAAQAAARAATDGIDTPPALLVLDPGVVDLGSDAASSLGAATTERARALLAWSLSDPTGQDDPEAAVASLREHTLDHDQLAAIDCPTLVVTADEAFGFRGQSAPLLASLRCPHHHVGLRAADGAGNDNGIDASQVHDAAVYDWWDATLVTRTGTPRTTSGDDDGGADG